ncbi:hypothetical protein RFI_00434 [Reticulomyxa filosa]|uniref:Sugar phosphate transporter domain-containing protein n=1 Tax=Reticulomyxa filosa TaxID=46433 RepID=X6PG02_RETFI|nr:hypothetical protein RFI_00434 [Reticulomyxa filosa]|eukprot:ETO36627.1 hypothetical protein RFI_00434 [Reticulomyxa filosa]
MLLARPHWQENIIPLLPVCLGIIITSFAEMELTLFGLIVSASSVFVSALKGVLSMKILQKDLKMKVQEYSFLLIVTPMSTVWIFIMEFVVNAGTNLFYTTDAVTASEASLQSSNSLNAMTNESIDSQALETNSGHSSLWYYLVLGGVLAFLTNIASIGTVKRTSASAMGVMANVRYKQALTVFLAMFVTENSWTMTKLFGSFITVFGAAWYSYQQEIISQKERDRKEKENLSSSESESLFKNTKELNSNNQGNTLGEVVVNDRK